MAAYEAIMLTHSIPQKAPHSRHREKGYFLLAMMLVVSLLVIAAAIAAPTIAFQIRRDREEEMVHRGVQYTRAIQAYYKKFGRYPTKLEDLDNTNNLRYLRKHYKDPLSKNQDFKLLHYGDPGVTMGFGGGITGANTVSQMNAGTAGNSAFGGSGSGFGSSGGVGGNSGSGFGGGNSSFGGGTSSFGGNSSFGGGNSSFGGNSNSSSGSGFGNSSNSNSNSTTSNGSNGSSGNQPSTGDSSQSGSATDSNSQQNGSSNGQGNNQVFGGGPIIGVASLSKETTIREYNKKKKYNEWQFIYDPSADRGGLIRTPYQTGLQNFGQNQLGQPANGTGQQPGVGSSSGFGGSNSSFGNSSGFGNSGSGFGNSTFGSGSSAPSQPPSSSPQPQ
jgi:type II secretory pathway pseudopilin PulG